MYLELLKAWLEETGLKEGGTVRVICKPSPTMMLGSTINWDCAMDRFIGKEFKVMHIQDIWIRLNFNNGTDLMKSWNFPFYCLEVIHAEKPEHVPVEGDIYEGRSGAFYIYTRDDKMVRVIGDGKSRSTDNLVGGSLNDEFRKQWSITYKPNLKFRTGFIK